MPSRFSRVCLVIAVALMSGCSGVRFPPLDSSLKSYHAGQDHVYHWPPLSVTDDTGAPTNANTSDWPTYAVSLLPFEGSNPAIAANAKGHAFVTGFDHVHRSQDAGRTWQIVREFRVPTYPSSADRYSTQDASVWVDAITDRVFVANNNRGCNDLAWSIDEGNTWTDANTIGVPCSGAPGSHLLTAPRGPDTRYVLPPTTSYPSVLYYCDRQGQQEGHGEWTRLPTFCSASDDGGSTWDPLARQGVFPNQEIAEHCKVVEDPVNARIRYFQQHPDPYYRSTALRNLGKPAAYTDGTIVIPVTPWRNYPSDGQLCPLAVALSRDNGASWSFRIMPDAPHAYSMEPETQIAITPDGTAYYAYRSNDSFVYVARSRDRFQTWEGPFRVAPQTHVYNRMVSVVAGSDGRIALAYLGTRTPQDPDSYWLDASTRWDLYATTSFNANAEHPSFVTQQVTPEEDPVQVGCVDPAAPDPLSTENLMPHGCQNLALTLNMARDPTGRVFVAFTDGCTPRNSCTRDTSSGFQARDRQVAVAPQNAGWSLFEEKGILPSLGISHPEPYGLEE